MKRKFILLPITLTALTPMVSMVGCGNPDKPEEDITINLVSSIGGSVKTSSLSIPEGSAYISKVKETLDSQVAAKDNFTFAYWSDQNNQLITESHVFVDGETIIAHFETLTKCFEWDFNQADKTAILNGFATGYEMTQIVIPSKVMASDGTHTVTTIGNNAFQSCTSLTEIVIPDSVTTINDFAFHTCTSLAKIVIPDSVTTIHTYAFQSCTSLTEIVIPDSVTSIDGVAFYGCTKLTEIVIPNSITSINYLVFGGCIGLTEIVIPDSVTTIDDLALIDCTGLVTIMFGGTSEQYRAIQRGEDWHSGVPATQVYCAGDGQFVPIDYYV